MGFLIFKESLIFNELEQEELKKHLTDRFNLVLKNEVTNKINYSNGILFHAIPDVLYEKSPINWSDENLIKVSLSKLIKSEIEFEEIEKGHIGVSKNDYIILNENGTIEAFLQRIVKQTPINFPPKIRYVQVENIISNFTEFINGLTELMQTCYSGDSPFTVYITLIGVNGVVFNSTDRDYTTTIPFPDETLTFQINEDKLFIKDDIEEAIHKKLYEFEPIA